MNVKDPRTEFEALDTHEKMIVALLAIAGEPMGRTRILEHIAAAKHRRRRRPARLRPGPAARAA
ncbi:hypothetical protein LP420_21520 [Massilia sp. B-10]|nr:hypothetical protein LP420_21520 [Massilia sp. B-10]